MSTGHLNLIFHGSFAFVYTRECVEVLIPNLDQAPSVTELPCCNKSRSFFNLKHTYCLTGVNRLLRLTPIPEKSTPTLSNFRVINRGSNALFCSLYLPFPEELVTLRCVCNKKGKLFDGPAASQIIAESVALVHVFTFKFSKGSTLRLGAIPITQPASSHTHNLHLFSEGGDPPGRAFERLTQLFPGMDLNLDDDGVLNAPPDKDGLPRGLQGKDQWSFSENSNQQENADPKHLSIVVDNT